MKRIIHRAAVALVGVLVPAMLSVGAASASTPSYGGARAAGDHNATAQGAEAKSTSVQVLPINANVPISVLSVGSNNGSVHQSNNSIAASNAENKNFTLQGQGEGRGPGSESCARPEVSGKDQGSPKQGGSGNATAQGAKAKSTSVQVLPINANVPISVLSVGSNNGSVHQSNNSIAASNAENKNFTLQGGGTGRGGEMPSWRSDNQGSGDRNATAQGAKDKSTSVQVLPINANVPISVLSVGSNNGSVHQSNNSIAASNAENKNFTLQGQGEGRGPGSESCGAPGQRGPFPGQPGFSQEAGPSNATAQGAKDESTSVQVLPINANVPISVLSVGSNNGSVHQSNNSIAASNAENKNFTLQGGGTGRGGEMPSLRSDNQGSGDRNATAQGAKDKSTSVQVLPINANVPISVLSVGSNNGSVHQSNNSIAASNAENKNFTLQGGGTGRGGEMPSLRSDNQGSGDHNATAQGAGAKSTSVQVLPINANVPISVLSVGSNNGSVHQSNNSVAASNAHNSNFTGQAVGPHLG